MDCAINVRNRQREEIPKGKRLALARPTNRPSIRLVSLHLAPRMKNLHESSFANLILLVLAP
jgi:hypothetical protein